MTNCNVDVVPGNTAPIIGITTPSDFPSTGETQGASPTDTDPSTSAPGETSSAPAATTTSAATTTTKDTTVAPTGPPGRFLQSGEISPSPARAQYHQLRQITTAQVRLTFVYGINSQRGAGRRPSPIHCTGAGKEH